MKVTPQQVYDMLVKDDKIASKTGKIRFTLDDISIVIKQKDVVGNIIQEWLQGWFKAKNIEYYVGPNSQMPPDIFLDKDDHTKNLLEVKAFNYNVAPAFDIADFKMYSEEIVKKPYMLDVDYLVFGYDMSEAGVITIKKVWLKKVWEMLRPMQGWPLNLQIKKKVVHKIRPGKWYSTRSTKFKFFTSLKDFVAAVEETVYKNKDTRNDAAEWKDRFVASYEDFYSKEIEIPRWYDIKSSYISAAPKTAKTKRKSTKRKSTKRKSTR